MKKMKVKAVTMMISLCLVMTSVPVGITMQPVQTTAKCYVFIAASGNGECYHTNKNCSRMRGRVNKLTKKAAKRRGYRACKKCYR